MQGWRTAFSGAYLPRRYATRYLKEFRHRKRTGYLDREKGSSFGTKLEKGEIVLHLSQKHGKRYFR